MMRPDPNPIQIVLREAMGFESFELDGDATQLSETWHDRPHLVKTPGD